MISANAAALSWLVQNWMRAEPFIQRAVDQAEGAFDIDHVWHEIQGGRAQLWPNMNSAVVTKITVQPSGIKSCLLWLCGGDDLNEIRNAETSIVTWAKRMSCTRIEIVGRRGWLRALPEFRESSTLLVKDI